MLGIFKPIRNSLGFDLREITYNNEEIPTIVIIKINGRNLEGLPVFKPLKDCKNKKEYHSQLKQ